MKIGAETGKKTADLLQYPYHAQMDERKQAKKKARNHSKQLSSLQEYVLIGSQYKGIDVYQREGAFWKQYSYREGDMVELASLGVRFPLERIYRGVRLR